LKKNHVLQVNNSIYTLYNVCQLRLLSLIFCHFIWFHPTLSILSSSNTEFNIYRQSHTHPPNHHFKASLVFYKYPTKTFNSQKISTYWYNNTSTFISFR